VAFDGWVVRVEADPAPVGPGVRVALEVHRQHLLEDPDSRPYGDPICGVGHFPRAALDVLQADLVLFPARPVVLAAGALPDGRPLRLEIRVLPPGR
jgi:hypothetical protein